MAKTERKYLAHFLDVNFGDSTASYVRLGKDLESYGEELNPQVNVMQNILGEESVTHSGYQVQSTADPFYAEPGDGLYTKLKAIAEGRLTGEACVTTRIDVIIDPADSNVTVASTTITVTNAWREKCWVVPNSFGGDTSGVQIPFTVYNAGERVKGTFVYTIATKTGAFTEST